MWIARNKDGILAAYLHKPHKNEAKERWMPRVKRADEYVGLPWKWFENIKWEDNEPTKFEIVIQKSK